MTNARKTKKVKSYNVKKEFEKIDRMFASLEKDKNLPTFGEFFMYCLMLGVSEKVNLRMMYPKTHTRLSRFLKAHDRAILRARK